MLLQMQRETGLKPGQLRVLLAVDTYSRQAGGPPTTKDLSTGWISVSLLRAYVVQLADAGYLERRKLSKRAAKRLVITLSGLSVTLSLKQAMRAATRRFLPMRARRFPAPK